jgi:hypothetical protein
MGDCVCCYLQVRGYYGASPVSAIGMARESPRVAVSPVLGCSQES